MDSPLLCGKTACSSATVVSGAAMVMPLDLHQSFSVAFAGSTTLARTPASRGVLLWLPTPGMVAGLLGASTRDLCLGMDMGAHEGFVEKPLQLGRVLGHSDDAVPRARVVLRRPRLEGRLRVPRHDLRALQHQPVLRHQVKLTALYELQRFVAEEVEAGGVAMTPPA